jgi:hypothetical protein
MVWRRAWRLLILRYTSLLAHVEFGGKFIVIADSAID